MKRRFPPFLNEDVLSAPEPRTSARILVPRQYDPDRTVTRRRNGTERAHGALRVVTSTSAALGSMTAWVLGVAATALLLAAPVQAAASGTPTTETVKTATRPADGLLTLAESAEVDGEGVFLDQIVTAPSGAPLPHIRLAPPPAVGQVTTLTRTQVVALIQSRAPAVNVARWIGSESTRVTRRTRNLDENDVREMLQATLQRDYVKDRGELELRLTRSWTPVAVADEPLTLKVLDLPASGIGANCIVRFELWAGQERLGSWQTPVTAKVWREVLIAETPLKRGQLLRDAPITRERRDILALREAAVVGLQDDGTGPGELELKENVGAGQPILARSLRVRPVVFRGSIVDALILDGAMTINLKVEVLEDGLPGNVVRVRNPKTRREMLGKVHNERTILIPM